MRELSPTSNNISSVGRLDANYQQFLVVANSQFTKIDDIANTVVSDDPANPVRLKDVAVVREGAADRKTLVTGNGKPAAIVNVTRQIGGNIESVSQQVKDVAFAACPPTSSRHRSSGTRRASGVVG